MAIWTSNTRQQKSSKSTKIIIEKTGSVCKITGDSKQRDSLGRTIKDKIGSQNSTKSSAAPDYVGKNSKSNLKDLKYSKNGFSSNDYSFQRDNSQDSKDSSIQNTDSLIHENLNYQDKHELSNDALIYQGIVR